MRLVLCALLVALSVPARASPECKTIAEARAAYHGKYLYWHTSRHCWNATPGRRHSVGARDRATERPQIPTTPAPSPMILFPTLVQGDTGVDPLLLAAEPATTGPPLIDIDEATGGGPAPIEPAPETPAANFRERWTAMPAAWIMARRP